jgi:hypothetical protein
MSDIKLTDNLDLAIENGDFVTMDETGAEEQYQELILLASQGSFRESPLTGVNIVSYIKKRFTVADVDKLRQKIILQMQYDGYSSVNTTINSFTDIEIDASR